MSLIEFAENEMPDYTNFVNSHDNASAYHNKAWAQAVERAYGFTPKYFGIKNNGEITAVLPAVLLKNIKAKKVLCSLPYCDLGGILATNLEAKQQLQNAMVDLASSKNWQYEYRDTELQASPSDTFEDGTKVRMLFTPLGTPEDQLASFKPKLRSQIKKASKNGVSARVIASPTSQELDDFYSVFTQNMRDLGSPVHSRGWFEAIFKHYNDKAFLVLTDFDNKCVGGGIVIHTETKAVIPWASTLREYNKLAPNMLLYWEVLSEVIRRGVKEFDFGRSSFNEGTYRFKKQWGALPQELNWQSLENGKLVRDVSSSPSAMRQWVEQTWQKLPVNITTALGPKIRKHISL